MDFAAGAHGESLAFIAKASIQAFVEELILYCRFESWKNSPDEHEVATGLKRERDDTAEPANAAQRCRHNVGGAAALGPKSEELQLAALQTGVAIGLHESYCDLRASGEPCEVQKHTLLWRSTGGRVSRTSSGLGLAFDVNEGSLLCLLGEAGQCCARDAATVCADIATQRSVDIAGILLDHVCEGDGSKIAKLRHRDEAARYFCFPPKEDVLQSAIEGTCCIKAHRQDDGKGLATLAFIVEWSLTKNVLVPVGFGLVLLDAVKLAADSVRVLGRPQA